MSLVERQDQHKKPPLQRKEADVPSPKQQESDAVSMGNARSPFMRDTMLAAGQDPDDQRSMGELIQEKRTHNPSNFYNDPTIQRGVKTDFVPWWRQPPSERRGVGGPQAKLQVNNPGDQYESEADRVAERVVSRDTVAEKPLAPTISRMPTEGQEGQAKEEVDPAVRIAQEIAGEAGQSELATLPDQQRESEGNADEGVQRKEIGVIQRKGFFKKLWGGIKSVGKGIANAAGKVWSGVKKGAGYVWKGVKAVGGYVWNVIKSVAALGHAMIIKVWPRIWKLIEHLATGAAGLVSWLWTGIKTTFTNPGQLGKWFVDGLKSGGAWVGRLATKIMDVMGVAEWLDFLGQVIKFNTRSLTSSEITEAKKVYGSAVPYWKVRVDDRSLIAKIALWGGSGGMGVTIGYTVNFSRPVTTTPGAAADMPWLIHELAHVAQCESRGLQYIPEALIAQHTAGYSYGGPSALVGKHLSDFNREQQGDICGNYYEFVLYGTSDPAPFLPLIDEAKAGKF